VLTAWPGTDTALDNDNDQFQTFAAAHLGLGDPELSTHVGAPIEAPNRAGTGRGAEVPALLEYIGAVVPPLVMAPVMPLAGSQPGDIADHADGEAADEAAGGAARLRARLQAEGVGEAAKLTATVSVLLMSE
jgi:hypothetical protein